MISKHIHCKAEHDNYKRLANYIADASHAGEKSLMRWCAGTWTATGADDDYELSIQEVMDTQALNTRTTKKKTYHLMISFRTEDEGKLSQADFKAIEERFAEVLGLSEHQRHCGVHINTDNMHMHIAYNLIHPDKLTRNEPYRDYHKRDKLCRELEKEYNISIDNGIDPLKVSKKLSDTSAKMESLKGEESFETYAINNHDAIMEKIETAQSWEDLHHTFALYGMELKPFGNGMVIKNKFGKQTMKASAFNRSISHKKMVDRFGAFTPMKKEIKEHERYKKTPLQKSSNRNELWAEFVKESQQKEIEVIKEKWRKEKMRITGLAVYRKTANELIKMVKNKELMEINKVRIEHEVKTENWLDFLREKAERGDEKALAVLRSKKEEIPREDAIQIQTKGKKLYGLQVRNRYLTEKDAILRSSKSKENKKLLLGVALMKTVIKKDTVVLWEHKITRNGTIIFTMIDGSKITDNGKEITFTGGAKATALDYASAKWGMKKLTPNEKELIKESKISYKNIEDFKKIDRQQALEKKIAIQKQKELDKQNAIKEKINLDRKKALEKIKSFIKKKNIEKKLEISMEKQNEISRMKVKKRKQGIQR